MKDDTSQTPHGNVQKIAREDLNETIERFTQACLREITFTYTDEQISVILAALPVNPRGNVPTATRQKLTREYLSETIQNHMRAYLREMKHQEDTPTPREIIAQLIALDTSLDHLQRCLQNLHPSAVRALELPWSTHCLQEQGKLPNDLIMDLCHTLRSVVSDLRARISPGLAKRQSGTERGRPRTNIPLRHFVSRLQGLWTKCGNPPPKRVWDAYLERAASPFYTFVSTIVAPIRREGGLDNVMRDVLSATGTSRKKVPRKKT